MFVEVISYKRHYQQRAAPPPSSLPRVLRGYTFNYTSILITGTKQRTPLFFSPSESLEKRGRGVITLLFVYVDQLTLAI